MINIYQLNYKKYRTIYNFTIQITNRQCFNQRYY